MRRLKMPEAGIYPVITGKFCKNGSSLGTLAQVIRGGAAMVQMREKSMTKRALLRLARAYRAATKKAGVVFIVNDYLDIAIASGADGLHLGQDDMPCSEARKAAPNLIIGVSTHDRREAVSAVSAGADYINIGPIFRTETKKNKMKPLGAEAIGRISSYAGIPFTVMGGIKENNIWEVLAHGARRVAMVTEITMACDVAAKTLRLDGMIRSKYGREIS